MNNNLQELKKLKMQKRVTKMKDGRYLIYYSFTNKVSKKSAAPADNNRLLKEVGVLKRKV